MGDLKVIEKDDKFRIYNQRLLLTYINTYDKKKLKSHLNQIIKTKGVRIDIGHYNEQFTYVYIDFNIRFETTKKTFFEYDNQNAIIRASNKKSEVSMRQTIGNFLSEIDNECSYLSESFADRIWSYDTISDMLADNIHNGMDVNGLKTLYELRPKKYFKVVEDICNIKKLRHWQAQIYKLIHFGVDSRKIYWFYDPTGGKGKSELMKFCLKNKPDKCTFTKCLNVRDLGSVLKNIIEDQHFKGDTIFVDIPRTKEDHQIYEGMEKLKDSLITVQKYMSKNLSLPKMHLIIFSNFLPHLEKVSLDRWEIFQLVTFKEIDDSLFQHEIYETIS